MRTHGRVAWVAGVGLALAALGCSKNDCVGPAGAVVKDGAGNPCTCRDGALVCTTKACAPAPASSR